MATPTVTYPNLVNGDPSDADQVDQNFADLIAFITNEVIQKDGSKQMTQQLSLVAADPTTANQATRKSYVDTLVANGPAALQIATSSLANENGANAENVWDVNLTAFSNPSRVVTVFALATGFVDCGANVVTHENRITADISFDNGGTWDSGPERFSAVWKEAGGDAVQMAPVIGTHVKVGTPSGNVRVRAMVRTDGTSPTSTTWKSGRLYALMIPS
jgi:hypothetical protein